jgi:TM2 domain-containing membrane protein YozV
MVMQKYYYVDASNQATGPLPYPELVRLQSVGQILPETFVVEEGGTEWKPFSSITPPQAPPPIPSMASSAMTLAANSPTSAAAVMPVQGRGDVRAMLQYDANKKSLGVTYFLWFCLGLFGGHRFYLGRWITGLVMMFTTLISIPFCIALVGYVGLFFVAFWAFIDAFRIPGWVRSKNNALIAAIGI